MKDEEIEYQAAPSLGFIVIFVISLPIGGGMWYLLYKFFEAIYHAINGV